MENGVESGSKSIMTLNHGKIQNGVSSDEVDLICVAQMQLELDKLKCELKDKNVECKRLQDSQLKVEAEIEDLTASLFEEANKMVYDANVKRHKAEKQLAEAKGNIDALQTEVEALKSLVITSTPSNPNQCSHPQLIKKKDENKLMSPLRRHRRNNSLIEAEKTKEAESSSCSTSIHEFAVSNGTCNANNFNNMNKEIDRCLFNEIDKWHRELHNSLETSTPDGRCNCHQATTDNAKALTDCIMITQSPFMSRVYKEDIALCLTFQNEDLSDRVSQCIHNNSLSVELISNPLVLEKCRLSGVVTQCRHRVRLDESDQYFPISQSCRNRLTTVCDFLTYIRYVRQGLVKHTVEQIYWEIIKLRMEMTFARLGYFRDQS